MKGMYLKIIKIIHWKFYIESYKKWLKILKIINFILTMILFFHMHIIIEK